MFAMLFGLFVVPLHCVGLLLVGHVLQALLVLKLFLHFVLLELFSAFLVQLLQIAGRLDDQLVQILLGELVLTAVVHMFCLNGKKEKSVNGPLLVDRNGGVSGRAHLPITK